MAASNRSEQIILTSVLEEIPVCVEKVRSFLSGTPYAAKDVQIVTILREGVANAMIHGNKMKRHLSVTITLRLTGDAFFLEISDQGRGFKREAVPDPLHQENMTRESGRGLFLMEQLADEVSFNQEGNRLTIKILPGE